MEDLNQLKLYSINAAAKHLHLGRDTITSLITTGKIGFVNIGNRKKIPYSSLVNYLSQNIEYKIENNDHKSLSSSQVDKIFYPSRQKKRMNDLGGNEILQNLLLRNK